MYPLNESDRRKTEKLKFWWWKQAANQLTEALVDHLNVGVAQAYLNQKRLDSEAKLLHQSATNFAKQTQVSFLVFLNTYLFECSTFMVKMKYSG